MFDFIKKKISDATPKTEKQRSALKSFRKGKIWLLSILILGGMLGAFILYKTSIINWFVMTLILAPLCIVFFLLYRYAQDKNERAGKE